MNQTSRISLTRAEIAQRSAKSALACYFLTLLTIGLSLLLQNRFVFFLALLMFAVGFLQTLMAKKVFANPLNEKCWNCLRASYWLLGSITAAILVTSVLSTDDTLHLVMLFAILAGVAGHFLLTTSLDRTLILPGLVLVHLPLIAASTLHYFEHRHYHDLFLTSIYGFCFIYSLIQYRFLHGQLTLNIDARLKQEKLNHELKNLDQKQDFFIQLALTLLSNKAPLDVVFNSILDFFEKQNADWVCSILFLDKNKKRFQQVYAPSIADFYNQAIKALDIGANAGSCGTAAYTGQRVIVENIQTDPLWQPYRELAAKAQLAACWSQPIKDKAGVVIGTFAIYHRSPHAPVDKDIRMIEQAAELVAIVLQHFETELLVRKTQDELGLIYNSSIDTMWLMDVEPGDKFRFRSVNDAFELATGMSRELVLGKLIEEVLPPKTVETTKAKYLEVIATGNVVDYLDVAVFPMGTKAGQIRLKPIFDEAGHCINILGIAEDITEKHNMSTLLSQRETDLMYAQKIARLGNWKWDLVDGKNTYTSKEVAAMLEYDENPEYPISFNDVNVFTPESWAKARPIVEHAIATGTSYEIDLQRKMKNGEYRWFTARGEVAERDTQGNAILLAGTMQDITERKNLENNLKNALKSRDEFIAVASHELKTPLTTIQLSLHTINRNLDELAIAAVDLIRPKLARAKSQSERLASLIDSLLDVTRMGSGKIHMDFSPDTNLSELTLSVLKKYEEELIRSNSVLTKEIEPQILGHWDKGRLEQIVTNLLTNAIKYGNGKPIEVSLRKVNNAAVLIVRDYGIGIPKDKQEKIFGRFERAVSETNYQGLGLGLWIVNEIVRAHNGLIWVESSEHQGSQFTVELPLGGGKHE